MLVQCWARVCDAVPTLTQHCVNVLCLLGCLGLYEVITTINISWRMTIKFLIYINAQRHHKWTDSLSIADLSFRKLKIIYLSYNIWVISPGNVQLPINVVVSIILALASLMSNIFLIQTPVTIFDRYIAWWKCIGFTVFHDALVVISSPTVSYLGPNTSLLTFRRHFKSF